MLTALTATSSHHRRRGGWVETLRHLPHPPGQHLHWHTITPPHHHQPLSTIPPTHHPLTTTFSLPNPLTTHHQLQLWPLAPPHP